MADPMSPEGVVFTPVSLGLAKVRVIAALVWTGLPAIGLIVAAILVHPVFWIIGGAAGALCLWLLWLLPRQVRAMAWAEGESDFMIRKGIMFRSLTLIPYGRIQYVDVNEGPIARRFGITSISLHTASAETSGSLDGVPSAEAVRLRDLLAQRGSAELAGL